MKYYLNFLIFLFTFNCSANINKFVILTSSYNNKDYYVQNLNSVFNQTYKNYRVIYTDDCSSDGTANLVEQYVHEQNQNHRFTLIKNEKRQLALANIYRSVLMCEDNEIVVMLDGDDQLANKNVLEYLNCIYQDENIWITYGNYKYLSSNAACDYDPRFPENIIKENKFREFPHGLTHLRTFRAWLFKQINIKDLFFEGYFYKMSYDVAIYTPMIEMACERHKFIDEIMYVYNDNNPLNDHKISTTLQHHLSRIIRQKNKYIKLENSQTNFLDKYDNSKVDVIIYSYNFEDLQKLINTLDTEYLSKIYIIYDLKESTDESLQEKYQHLGAKIKNSYLINKSDLSKNMFNKIIRYIFDNGETHILFLSDKNYNKISIKHIIKLLETTKAFSILFCSNTSDFLKDNNAQIMNKIYAFEYSKAKYINFINVALYRKKDIYQYLDDIEKMEVEWKYFGWNKICLISFDG